MMQFSIATTNSFLLSLLVPINKRIYSGKHTKDLFLKLIGVLTTTAFYHVEKTVNTKFGITTVNLK